MLKKEVYRSLFPVSFVRNRWEGQYLAPEEVRERVAVATCTRYRDNDSDRLRSGLAYRNLKELREQGYEVVVVDSGSPEGFLGQVRDLGVILLRREPETMGRNRRPAIREASQLGREVVACIEPEKYPLAPEIHRLASPLLAGEADCIVPFRDWNGMESYPETQRSSELFINLAYAKPTGFYLDYPFGPKFWRREYTEYFLEGFERLRDQLDLEDQWDSHYIPPLLMVKGGLRVGDVTSLYRHPPEQTALEEKDSSSFDRKRAKQAFTVLTSLEKVVKHLGIKSVA